MAGETVRVEGLNELVRAFGKLDKDLRRGVQKELAGAAEIVKQDWVSFLEMTISRTTGKRPDYGRHQMWYLLKALRDKEPEVLAAMDAMLGRIGGDNGF